MAGCKDRLTEQVYHAQMIRMCTTYSKLVPYPREYERLKYSDAARRKRLRRNIQKFNLLVKETLVQHSETGNRPVHP